MSTADNDGWTVVSHKKKKTKKNTVTTNSRNPIARASRTYTTEQTTRRRNNINNNTNRSSSYVSKFNAKVDEDTGNYHVKRVSSKMSAQIVSARIQKGWNQKQFAKECNLPLSVIQEYEKGIAIPNGSYINKMSKILGQQLSNK